MIWIILLGFFILISYFFTPNKYEMKACPKCGSQEIRITNRGMWDGKDSDGNRTGGAFRLAQCESCDAHFQNYTGIWDEVKHD